jgi:quercetin dioxygenase-like cupin family protein
MDTWLSTKLFFTGGPMKTRFLLCGLFLLPGVLAAAREIEPGPVIVNYAEHPLTVGGADYSLITFVQDLPAGAGIATHPQGGYLLVTVMSGAVTTHENGAERVISAGESWAESPGHLDSVLNPGPDPARIVVSALLPKGAPLATVLTE